MTNLAGLSGIVLVLAQKVPHPGDPLSRSIMADVP